MNAVGQGFRNAGPANFDWDRLATQQDRRADATITINARDFAIQPTDTATIPYLLSGKRNANYMVHRVINAPDFLFVMQARGAGKPFGDLLLTDFGGVLRLADGADWKQARTEGRVK